jgi:hypothetical protein
MKNFDIKSFLLGLGGAVAFVAVRRHLRPILVELASTGIHFGKLGYGIAERQREHAEDLWAEIGDRVRRKATGRDRAPEERRAPRGTGAAPNGAGAPSAPVDRA